MPPFRTRGVDDDATARRPAGLEARLADALVTRLVESRFSEALLEQVLAALGKSPDLERLVTHLLAQPGVNVTVDELVDRQVARVLQELRRSEAVRELVREQADAYLNHVAAHPEVVQDLVREQVDRYLAHLTEHPEAVRQLIQDQSRGMLRDVQAMARARAFLADDAVDAWVRRLLRRS